VLLIDDHLLRGVLAGRPHRRVRAARTRGQLATTELFYHRLCCSFARSDIAGRLSAPVAALTPEVQERFRAQLLRLPDDIVTVPIRVLASRMAELKQQFRVSTLVSEALAAAEQLGAAIALDPADLGPRMQAAARALHLRVWIDHHS
jgi:hypothetical protein